MSLVDSGKFSTGKVHENGRPSSKPISKRSESDLPTPKLHGLVAIMVECGCILGRWAGAGEYWVSPGRRNVIRDKPCL